MIKVTFYYNDEFKIKGFELKGHANYDEFGYDIVCAAATTNSIGVVNSLEELQNVGFEVQAEYVAIIFTDNNVLRYIDETTSQVTRVGRTQSRIGQALTSPVTGRKVIQYG